MVRYISLWILLCICCSGWSQQCLFPKTTFQSSHLWRPISDLKTDAVLIYDVKDVDGESFEYRVNSWRIHGYRPQLMISFSWGEDSLHKFKRQTLPSGKYRMHGSVPYLIPDEAFCKYIFRHKVKRAIDAGIKEIVFEEPEFYILCNPEINDSCKNKILLNALQLIISLTKKYSQDNQKDIRCFVATHSIFNYANWGIISPEILLSRIDGLDGIIGQVWQDTAKNPFDNRITTFEQAYLEYTSLSALMNSSNQELFFLTDPVGDKQKTWEEYREGYLATTIAMCMISNVNHYEVLPWPHRIFEYRYKLNGKSSNLDPIPSDFFSLILILNQIMAELPKQTPKDCCNVLISNQLMKGDGEGNMRTIFLQKYYQQLFPLIRIGADFRFVFEEDSIAIKNIGDDIIYVPTILPTPHKYKRDRRFRSDLISLNIPRQNIYQRRRGNYLFAYAIPNSASHQTVPAFDGAFIDILDKNLQIVTHKEVSPNNVSLLYDISTVDYSKPGILVSASTDSIIKRNSSVLEYVAFGPDQSFDKQRICLSRKPKKITIEKQTGQEVHYKSSYDDKFHMLFLSFPNDHQGCHVTIVS